MALLSDLQWTVSNVNEQISSLRKYTKDHKIEQPKITALVGADIIDGVSDRVKKDMTLIIESGKIKSIGSRFEIKIPENAKIIDVSEKTLIPGSLLTSLFTFQTVSTNLLQNPLEENGGC